MNGTRLYLEEHEVFPSWLPGSYWKDHEGVWWMVPPATGFPGGKISKHDVTEHEDGTITASPSILVYGHHGKTWHGYLERGVWREC